MSKIILDLCGGTGSWSKPYEEVGYDVRLVTLPDNDVKTYKPPSNVYGILAAPPCTMFSIARNHKLSRDIASGMEIVNACLKIIEISKPKFWALENPAGKLKSFLGKPKFSFQPYEFGDGWTKRTLVWGNFNIPNKIYKNYEECPQLNGGYVRPNRKTISIAFNHLKTHGKYFEQLKPFFNYCLKQKGRQKDSSFRAITPPGFAKSFFEANK